MLVMLLAGSTAALQAAGSGSATLPVGAPRHLATLPLGEELSGHRSTGQPFVAHRLSERPHTFLLRNFLSEEECEQLITSAKLAGLETAETTGGTSSRRACSISTLSPWDEATVKTVQRDAARMLLSEEAISLPGGGCEDLHVLRYQPGGQYLPHYDAMTHPRVLTIIYYLNGVGATWFPLADSADGAFATHKEALARVDTLDPARDGLRVEPASRGDALVFYNHDSRGEPDPLALHSGLEVEGEEEKWIGTHFFNVPALCAR